MLKLKALTLILISILLTPALFFPMAPPAEAFLIDDEWQNREYTHAGGQNDVYFQVSVGAQGVILNIIPAGIGYVWAWLVVQGNWLDGKILNITSWGNGLHPSRHMIMDGAYNRSDDTQFLSDPGVGPTGLVDMGNGELQLLKNDNMWANTTDSYTVNINNALFYVSIFFMTRCTSAVATGHMEAYLVTIQNNIGDPPVYNENLEGMIIYDDPPADPERSGIQEAPPGLDDCVLVGITLLNPEDYEDDGIPYIYTEEKYYLFNASWIGTVQEANMTRFYSIQFTAGLQNFTLSYNYTNNKFKKENGSYLIQTMNDGQDYDFDIAASTFWVVFYVYLDNDVEDTKDVQMSGYCSKDIGWEDSTAIFHIYSQGEAIEIDLQFNATRPEHGEWFEMCAWETGIASANKTLRKFEHFNTEFAVRFYKNDSGTWVPEDQFMQDPGHLGAPPDTVWAGPGDWRIRFNIWAYDNTTSQWIILWGISFWMFEGNQGPNNMWTAIRTQARNRTHWLTDYYETFTAFIEEEPAARFRLWMDLWFSPTNYTSVAASRLNPYFYAMQNTGWFLWGTWSPFLANVTEAMYFTPVTNGNDVITQASQFDLMKIEAELDFGPSGASELYMVCIEDVNINEIQTAPRGSQIQGVGTPIYNAPKVPDMPITGILAPVYSALTQLAGWIWDAAAAILDLAWQAISDQFPWFTQFIEDLASLINSFSQFLQSITAGLVELLNFMADSLWLFPVISGVIGDTWVMLTSWLDPFVANAGDWILLAVIVFGIIPFAANLSAGRTSAVRADIETVWGFLSTILEWTFRLAKMAIDFVLGLIPG